ncbi:MAG TPA: glycoside hydrolase family 2 TIM barrel-domain containing protein [Thermoanaerobaculia bacterium]|nr:glycoside hydrolase family 2 TIM barrel-domain containing protein [Thermoanaerobaculia bacterium]
MSAESPPRPHRRPQLTRRRWLALDGRWDFALDRKATWVEPDAVPWGGGGILVPFAPETRASGVAEPGFFDACWYRRGFARPPLAADERLHLHFGAVDYAARVWVNGIEVARHAGGYTPFWVDVTPVLVEGEQTVVVRAHDDPRDLAKPRGKQDWLREPHSIWYPRTSGIWQTVWLEPVPATRIAAVRWRPSLEQWEIGLNARVAGAPRERLRLRVHLTLDGRTLADDTFSVIDGEVNRRIAPSDPGIDDDRNRLLWSPANPALIAAELELLDETGRVLDEVGSYTALRSVGVEGDRFLLNNRVHPLRMVLDQGYWPESGLTAPDDDALRRDVELAKAMGFNGVRKHQKIEDPRYLYWADRLGLMVWEEMPSAYRFTGDSVERLTREWMAAIERDRNHPSIVAWVPFNESWGVPDLPAMPAQRHYVQALYHLTKTLDPDRPVVGNDGWESTATDIIGIHDYEDDLERLKRRYERPEVLPQLFRHGRPAGRLLTIEGYPHAGQPIVLTEFGGIAVCGEDEAAAWGYSLCTPEQLGERYAALLEVVRDSELLAGFCYTQLADTYQEVNGLLAADRTPKLPLEEIARATRGR